jgi:hypothetical protein
MVRIARSASPADCDRIAGALPALGEHRENVMATHQPLRMPHDRLTIIAHDATTAGGVARTATLSLDGQPVGMIQHGPGQQVVFRPDGPRFSQQDLDDFARVSRWRGRQVDTPRVLLVLIAEYETTTQVAAAEAQGFIAVIVRDGDDHIVGTDIVLEPRPFAPGDRQTLAELFHRPGSGSPPGQTQLVWQIWTGRRWQLLGIVDVPRDTAPTEHEVPGADQASTITGSAGHPAVTTPPDPHPAGHDVPETGGTARRGEDQ